MSEAVRVRFAPSPTGDPHVGNIRTALYNFLYARHTGGVFILRIEDTDQSRKVEGSMERILEALRWLGMQWDEGPEVGGAYGPYVQSERLSIYREYVRRLLQDGFAYPCFCTQERLAEMRREQQERNEGSRYDRHCRRLSPAEREALIREGHPYVVRLAVPERGQIRFNDLIRGTLEFDNETIDDQVLLKSDGFPTYHLANVVDDHLMHITHVIRAEEWLSSTPKHVILYEAFGWEPPVFAHLPMILGPDRSKLSKRHGAVGILEYRKQGYLPEAMVNFLALLGWSTGTDEELMSLQRLTELFELEKVNKAPAVFDTSKLDYMNGWYIRQLSPEELAERCLPFLRKAGLVPSEATVDGYLVETVKLVQERLKLLSDVPDMMDFFFGRPEYDYSLVIPRKGDAATTAQVLGEMITVLEKVDDFSKENLEAVLRGLAADLGVKAGAVLWPLRAALTGKKASPGAFEVAAALGRDETLARLQAARVGLQSLAQTDG